MDNLTHSLAAVLLARTGLGRLAPAGTALTVLAANLPDVDIVASLWGSLAYLEYHRHFTHALLAVPVLGLAAALPFAFLPGWRLARAAALGSIGVFSHVLLDLANHYGVRIWLPWSGRWVDGDIFVVIEPWLLAVLLLCVLAPHFSRLVGSEIGGRQPAATGRGWAAAGLLFLALWAGGRWILHERALRTLESRLYGSEAPVRTAAWPTPWNPFVWRGYVSTATAWRIYQFHVRRRFDPDDAEVYPKPADAAALAAAAAAPETQSFLRFARFPVWRLTPVSEPEGGTLAEATDVRFGSPEGGRFQLRVVLDPSGTPVSATFSFGDPTKGMGVSK